MDAEIKKEILYDLQKSLEILRIREKRDLEELRQLSDHAIEHVASYKDLDVISVTVLIYSIYKTYSCIGNRDYADLLNELELAARSLEKNQFGKYNSSIKRLYEIIRRCSSKTKEHLQDVMHASRIKKGTLLLSKGLSIGQAAGLMGLSNWDLQQYAGRTTALEEGKATVPVRKRITTAFKIFGVR
ncbi:hypothetical protein HY496_02155 [Candidatus Woesearchaeota archaeon]|nr:hypothetical protein [Candidatus Woesearchaeota archaeon]